MFYQCNVISSLVVAIVASLFLVHYCTTNSSRLFFWREKCDKGFDCIEQYFLGPIPPLHKDMTDMLKEMYMSPPPNEPKRFEFDINLPVWRKLVDWNIVQEKLIEIFKDRPPGFFVEVGAADGDFMSQTLYLEQNLQWTGLLIEPDPRSYAELVKMKRNAWTSPVCIKFMHPTSQIFWLRRIEENLPHHFIQLLRARSKLDTEIMDGDAERGFTITVPCVPLVSLLKAIEVTQVDMLTVNTGVEDNRPVIKDILKSKSIDVKVLLLHYSTSILMKNPFPQVPGFILDVMRSQLLVKIYIKEKYCELVSDNECHQIGAVESEKVCHQFFCFGFLKVISKRDF